MAALTHGIGLDAVGRALFSADLSGPAQDLLDATSRASALVVRLGRSVLPTAAWAPTPTNVRLRATRRRLDRVSAELVRQRRARGRRSPGGGHGDDLLGLLLDSDLTDAQVRDELVTMIVAGHETVAAALAWTLMLLAEHPSAQDRVRDELAAHTGPVGLLGHRETLPWTRAVVDEALRLFPPAWALSRRSHRDDVVGGHEVPAGTLVIVSPWVLHRRGGSWPDAGEFRPERFLGATAAPPAYLPFGQGPRLCIGRELALGEMVVVLARLLGTHRVGLPPGWTRPAPRAQVAVHPRGGMPLTVTRGERRRTWLTSSWPSSWWPSPPPRGCCCGPARRCRGPAGPPVRASVAVVVPARDEEATAARPAAVAARRSPRPGSREVVVVDDASRDGTAAVARAGGARGR